MSSPTLILGLETSCDETAAAVVADGVDVRSNVVATQHELHERYAGVVPEIASRAHLERLVPVVRQAMEDSGTEFADLDAIAVGHRPGLIGSLLVGVSAAKALSWRLERPLIGVDHVAAHLHAGMLGAPPVHYPAIGLVVSGGHTTLYRIPSAGALEVLGRTIDDAIGEAYDKVATMLQLGYPGGPAVDRLAAEGDETAFDFPVGLVRRRDLDFSFSGLKTAVLYAVRGRPAPGATAPPAPPASIDRARAADVAASFQRAAVGAVMRKLRAALETERVRTLLVGGGVSANSRLRRELVELAGDELDLRLPALEYCLDNAAMIAGAAFDPFRAGRRDGLDLRAETSTALGARGRR